MLSGIHIVIGNTVVYGIYFLLGVFQFETATYALVRFVIKETVIAQILSNVQFELLVKQELPISKESES